MHIEKLSYNVREDILIVFVSLSELMSKDLFSRRSKGLLILHIQVSAGDESRMAGDGVLYGRR